MFYAPWATVRRHVYNSACARGVKFVSVSHLYARVLLLHSAFCILHSAFVGDASSGSPARTSRAARGAHRRRSRISLLSSVSLRVRWMSSHEKNQSNPFFFMLVVRRTPTVDLQTHYSCARRRLVCSAARMYCGDMHPVHHRCHQRLARVCCRPAEAVLNRCASVVLSCTQQRAHAHGMRRARMTRSSARSIRCLWAPFRSAEAAPCPAAAGRARTPG